MVTTVARPANTTHTTLLATTASSHVTRRGPVAKVTSRRPFTSSLPVDTIHDIAKNEKMTAITTEAKATKPTPVTVAPNPHFFSSAT